MNEAVFWGMMGYGCVCGACGVLVGGGEEIYTGEEEVGCASLFDGVGGWKSEMGRGGERERHHSQLPLVEIFGGGDQWWG